MKWQSDQNDYQYFEKQDDGTWTYYYNRRIMGNYPQVSIDRSSNNYPVVVLFDKLESFFVKLTESMVYWGFNRTYIQNTFVTGYWTKKDGTFLLLLNLKRFSF